MKEFQSLIGTLQTGMSYPQLIFCFSFNPLQVRYKLSLQLKCWLGRFRFQSLIGTLQTPHSVLQSQIQLQFQSLIGTLQTKEDTFIKREKRRFQSLIGTLQTSVTVQSSSVTGEVSIPYRYATNFIFAILSPPKMFVSIPYRYATNYSDYHILAILQRCFNPLQVRYKL